MITTPVSPEMYLHWSAVSRHLSLEGLEAAVKMFPVLRDEAEALAKPKRLIESFKKIVTNE